MKLTTRPSRCRATAPVGFVTAFFAVVIGFALIWHIWSMAILGLAAAVTMLVAGWSNEREREVPAVEIATLEARSGRRQPT